MCISACELRYRPGSWEGGHGRGKRHWGRGQADGWFMLHAHCPWSSSIRNIDLETRSWNHVASLVSGGVSGLGVFFSISQVLFRLRGLEPPYKTGSLHHDRSFSVTSFLDLYLLPVRTTTQLMTKWRWPRVLRWSLMSEGQIKQLNKQFQLESRKVSSKLPSYSNVVQRILIFLAFFPPLDHTNWLWGAIQA